MSIVAARAWAVAVGLGSVPAAKWRAFREPSELADVDPAALLRPDDPASAGGSAR